MKKRFLIISLLCLTAVTGGVFSYISQQNNTFTEVEASEGNFVADKDLPETYRINSDFITPKGKISYKDNLYSYNDYYLKYPDGKTYKKDRYVLDVAGLYECGFVHKSASLTLFAYYNFRVYNDAYQFNKEGSYAKYVDAIPTNYNPTPGISVTLAENDVFTFNQVVNINGSSLDEPIVVYHPYSHSLRANPNNKGKDMAPGTIYEYNDPDKPRPLPIDANCSTIRVTDAYDPSIYFETFIYYRTANTSNNRQQFYAVIGASNQDKVGIEPANAKGTGNRLVNINGVSYREYIGLSSNSFGATLNTATGTLKERRYRDNGESFTSAVGTTFDLSTTADLNNADDYGFSIYYDYETMKVYIKHISTFWINDLDEAVLHGSNAFPGFTTGEVIISVYGSEYFSDKASYDIEKIYGVDNLNIENVKDETAPVITLDNDNNDFNIAVNEKFHLFNPTIIDYNYHGDSSTAVYYEYGSSQEHQVSVIDNSFTPTQSGRYTVVYTARDSFGNVGTRLVNLNAIVTSSNKSIDFNVEEINEVDAGQKITLPTPTITVYNNTPSINCRAVYEDGDVIDINTNSWSLFVKKPGNYEIIYDYSDGISTYTYSYNMVAKPSDNIYLDDLSLPKYIIKNASYTLDYASAIKADKKELSYYSPDVYINEDDKGFNRKVDIKNVSTNALETVQFEYRYDNRVIYTSDIIPVKDVGFNGRLNKEAYFDNENIVSESNSSYVRLNTATSGTAKSTFVNPLNFSNFHLTLDLSSSKFNGAILDVVLTDFEDENNQYVFTFNRSDVDNTVKVSYNGVVEYSVNPISYTLTYDPLRQIISDSFDNSDLLANPFKSDRFYLSFVFHELNGAANLDIRNINGQTINNVPGDAVSPVINVPNIEGTHYLGEQIDLEFLYPSDTLSPYFENNYFFTVTYYKNDDFEDGEIINSNDGTLLDGYQDINKFYSFNLDKPGVYEIYYSYKDQAGNSSGNSGLRIIYNVDSFAPEITLNNGYNTSTVVLAKLNSKHKIQGYIASDNYDKDVEVSTYVLSPNFIYTKMTGKTVTLDEIGDYRIYYVAKDSSGNIASTYYTVRVS